MNSLKRLSDKELTGRLRQLVSKEQSLTLSILPHLAEVERRGLYLEKAYSTLSDYCIHELGYGESSAWRRVRAAKVIKEVPEVYDLMKENRLSFSAVLQVANVLNPENSEELLPRIERKSKIQIDKIVAEYQSPQMIPDQARPKLVKKEVPVHRALAGAPLEGTGRHASGPELGEISLRSEGKNNPTVNISTCEIEVVLERMFEIRFAADEELMELIQWMKSHLSHKFPKGASFLDIFKYAIKYLKRREDPAVQYKPRKSSAKTDTRYIPKSVKQQVWKKYNGKCAFVGVNNRRCNSDRCLQYDHYPVPFARGGPSTVSNLRLLCAKHNRYTAEQVYGEKCMKKHYIKETAAVYLTSDHPSAASRSAVKYLDFRAPVRTGQRPRAGLNKGSPSTVVGARG